MSRPRNRRQSTAITNKSNLAPEQTDSQSSSARPDHAGPLAQTLTMHGWALALLALVIVVTLQLGALDWYARDRLVLPDGSSERIPNTFASIDHPFHISKERSVLDAIRDGDFPRWFSNHQAGYPTEFYPLGADLVVAAAWGIGLGQVPLEVIHKLVVIAVLFIPVAAYWVIARRDGWPASVAVTAAILHLFVPGSWLGGGPDELLRMGMWPNVFAAYLTLPLMLWAADYLRGGSYVRLVIASSVASLAIYTNPRATIAVATVLLAVGIVILRDRQLTSSSSGSIEQSAFSTLTRRLLALALLIFLLTATLIVPLRSHQDLYEFTRFVEFSSVGKVWEYVSGAIPIEVMVVAAIGAVVTSRTDRFHSRVLALWMPMALLVSLVAGGLLRDLPILSQLEGPRLLPLVRLPALFLAAVALHTGVQFLLRFAKFTDTQRWANVATVAVAAASVLTPISPLSGDERGLPETETTDQHAYTEIARTAGIYQQLATPSDRPLIIGSPLSDHASFWIPALTDSNAFHAAWVWYWKTPGYADRTQIADINSALEIDFLRRHALTMVLIATNDADSLQKALSKPHLHLVERAESGGYAVFQVDDAVSSARGPISLVTGSVIALEMSREHLVAEIESPQASEVRIAVNAFPGWKATVDGANVPVRRSDDGFMLVDVPAGDVVLELTYTTEPAVWIGRALTTTGLILMVVVVIVPRVRRRPSSD